MKLIFDKELWYADINNIKDYELSAEDENDYSNPDSWVNVCDGVEIMDGVTDDVYMMVGRNNNIYMCCDKWCREAGDN